MPNLEIFNPQEIIRHENNRRMCMNCGNDSKNNSQATFSKKRIAILSTMGAGLAGATYLSVTVNPALGASIPTILAFAACPAMCAAMGGTMWLGRLFTKKKQSGKLNQDAKEELSNSEKMTAEDHHGEKSAVIVTEGSDDDEETLSYEQPPELRRKRRTNPEEQENIH